MDTRAQTQVEQHEMQVRSKQVRCPLCGTSYWFFRRHLRLHHRLSEKRAQAIIDARDSQ